MPGSGKAKTKKQARKKLHLDNQRRKAAAKRARRAAKAD